MFEGELKGAMALNGVDVIFFFKHDEFSLWSMGLFKFLKISVIHGLVFLVSEDRPHGLVNRASARRAECL